MRDYSRQVSKEVRIVMIRRDVDQQWLAERTGISQSTISRRLRGVIPWPVDELQLVAAALHVPVTELLPPVPSGVTRRYSDVPVQTSYALAR